MNNNFQITATIVTYNNEVEELQRAINSFLNTKLVIHLYIVDNSPTERLKKFVTYDNRIEYIFMNANEGFGAGHNVVMSLPGKLGNYHLILNPDIQFEAGVLEILYDYMEKNQDVGNVMPKVIYPTGEIQNLCKLLPTPMTWIGRMIIPFKSLKKKLSYNFEMQFADMNKEMNVPYLSGCFMFIRTSVIKEVGLFDTGIFMYGEDTDLNRRIYTRHRTMYYPKVTIIHRHEQGSHKNFKLLWIHIKAAIYYLNKWGWFFDKERTKINKETIEKYSLKKHTDRISSY